MTGRRRRASLSFLSKRVGPAKKEQWATIAMLVLVIAGFVIGFLTVTDYGQSWDEAVDLRYGKETLRAYSGSSSYLALGELKYYGPFYLMIWARARTIVPDLHTAWLEVDTGHLLNFTTFLLAALALFVITRRYVRPWIAVIAVLLFILEPLIYGHAFINQKDIPFMAAFASAVAIGMTATDQLFDRPVEEQASGFWVHTRGSFRALFDSIRQFVLVHPWLLWIALFGASIVALLALGFPPQSWLARMVTNAYRGESWPMVNVLFQRAADHADQLPATAYVTKASAWLSAIRVAASTVCALAALSGFLLLLAAALRSSTGKAGARVVLLVFAGLVTGLATSTRFVGPLAGALVSIYLLSRHKQWGVLPLVGYWLAAAVGTFVTWPFLWSAPVAHLVEAVRVMSNFQAHKLLFNGQVLESTQLPWNYLPLLLAIQLTLPTLAFFIWGSAVLIMKCWRGILKPGVASVPILWLGIPFLAFEVLRTPLYGNLRQVLFIFPPMFIIGAVGIEDVLQRIGRGWLNGLIVLVALLPGVISIWRLHPYEFAYFNQLVGGPAGAAKSYHLDPWCTSYREAMSYVNAHAPPEAVVAVWGPVSSAETFAREDLVVRGEGASEEEIDFALGCKWMLNNPAFFQGFEPVHRVTRAGAMLAEVKVRPGVEKSGNQSER